MKHAEELLATKATGDLKGLNANLDLPADAPSTKPLPESQQDVCAIAQCRCLPASDVAGNSVSK